MISDKPRLFKPKKFSADAKLSIDGNVIYLNGFGSIDHENGVVRGDYEASELPDEIDPFIFKTVMVTGYPSVCRPKSGINPFFYGGYSYQREVDFGQHGHVRYSAHCSYSDDGEQLQSKFDLEGSIQIPSLRSAGPVVETWIPNGNEIIGAFTIAWPQVNSDIFVIGHARTIYVPPVSAPKLRNIAHREIQFPLVKKSGRALHITQVSEVGLGIDA